MHGSRVIQSKTSEHSAYHGILNAVRHYEFTSLLGLRFHIRQVCQSNVHQAFHREAREVILMKMKHVRVHRPHAWKAILKKKTTCLHPSGTAASCHSITSVGARARVTFLLHLHAAHCASNMAMAIPEGCPSLSATRTRTPSRIICPSSTLMIVTTRSPSGASSAFCSSLRAYCIHELALRHLLSQDLKLQQMYGLA